MAGTHVKDWDRNLSARERAEKSGLSRPSMRSGLKRQVFTSKEYRNQKENIPHNLIEDYYGYDDEDSAKELDQTRDPVKTVPRTFKGESAKIDKFFDGRAGNDRAKTLGVTNILQYPREPIGSWDQHGGGTRYGGTEGVAQNGHYILFYINVNDRTKKVGGDGLSEADKEKIKNMKKEKGQTEEQFKSKKQQVAAGLALKGSVADTGELSSGRTGRGDAVFEAGGIISTVSESLNSGLRGARAANKTVGEDESLYAKKLSKSQRLKTAVALYMPAQVQTSYNLQYSDVEYGFKAQGFGSLFDKLGNEGGDLTGQQVTGFARKAAQGMLNTMAPGATAAMNIKQGLIISNRMELSFQGVGRREFQFVFNFLPKSELEATEVEDIISIFKYYSHPDFISGSSGNMMTIPDTFDISYMYQGSENSFLNKISTCFCTGIQVSYGGDRYATHTPTVSRHGGGALSPPPTRSTLTLSFKELEILTKPRINQGY